MFATVSLKATFTVETRLSPELREFYRKEKEKAGSGFFSGMVDRTEYVVWAKKNNKYRCDLVFTNLGEKEPSLNQQQVLADGVFTSFDLKRKTAHIEAGGECSFDPRIYIGLVTPKETWGAFLRDTNNVVTLDGEEFIESIRCYIVKVIEAKTGPIWKAWISPEEGYRIRKLERYLPTGQIATITSIILKEYPTGMNGTSIWFPRQSSHTLYQYQQDQGNMISLTANSTITVEDCGFNNIPDDYFYINFPSGTLVNNLIMQMPSYNIKEDVIKKSIAANAFGQGVSGEIEMGLADFVVMKVKFWQKNNLSRIETRNIDPFKGQPVQMITVSDGTTLWSYNKTENWGTKTDLSRLPRDIRGEIEKNNSIYNLAAVSEEFAKIADVTEKTRENKKYYVLTVNDLSPIKELPQKVKESPDFKKVLVWLDSDTYLISRIETYGVGDPTKMFGFVGTRLIWADFKNLSMQPIPDSIFKYTPPPGMKITDNADSILKSMQGKNSVARDPGFMLTGTVKDGATRHPIAGATVSDDGYGPKPYKQATTDSTGKYQYATWGEEHFVVARAPGYRLDRKTLITDLFQLKKQGVLNFELTRERSSEDLFVVAEQPGKKATTETNGGILETVIQGIAYNDSLIKNISFNYTIDYKISNEWLKSQSSPQKENLPEGMVVRDPTKEHVIITGTLKAEGDKFFITSTTTAVTDGKVLQDMVLSFDGTTLTRLNLLQDYGDISQGLEFMGRNSIIDPRNIQLFFLDGESLYKVLTDKTTETTFINTENIDEFPCYCLNVNIPYSNEEGKFVAKKIIWIDLNNGFRVRKALIFDRRMPERALTTTRFTLEKFPGGIWYPTKVIFESERLNLPPGPHTTIMLDIKNVSINRNLFGKNTFTADINRVSRITDLSSNGFTFQTQK